MIRVKVQHPTAFLSTEFIIQGRLPLIALCIVASFAGETRLFARGGTSPVAAKGQPAYVQPGWPDGVDELVNDASRTAGWNSWFSEWPNDVNHYAFEIKSTADLNRLIEKLASIKSELRQVRLSHTKEPRGLGWVTQLPQDNNIPVLFSIGDQSRIDEWYGSVRKPFGVMEFTAAPVAVPPTLTIFVQNEAVKLEDLKIPASIDVIYGDVPTIFHRDNTTIEQALEKEPAERRKELKLRLAPKLDADSQAAADKIQKFLKQRNAANE